MFHIKLTTEMDAVKLVGALSKCTPRYYLYTPNKKECVNAKSFLGIMYFMSVHPNEIYLECDDPDAMLPETVKKFVTEG